MRPTPAAPARRLILLALVTSAGCDPVLLGRLAGVVPAAPPGPDAAAADRPAPAAGPAAPGLVPGGPDLDAGPAGAWRVVFHAPVALRAVWGQDEDRLFVAGDGGRVYLSVDRGRSFRPRATGTTRDLHALWGADGLLLAGGDGSTVLATTTSGDRWVPLPTGDVGDVRALWGTSALAFVVVGGRAAQTIDGGKRFSEVPGASGGLLPVWSLGSEAPVAGPLVSRGRGRLLRGPGNDVPRALPPAAQRLLAVVPRAAGRVDDHLAVGWATPLAPGGSLAADWTTSESPFLSFRAAWSTASGELLVAAAGVQAIASSIDGGVDWRPEWERDGARDISALWSSEGGGEVFAVTLDGEVLRRQR